MVHHSTSHSVPNFYISSMLISLSRLCSCTMGWEDTACQSVPESQHTNFTVHPVLVYHGTEWYSMVHPTVHQASSMLIPLSTPSYTVPWGKMVQHGTSTMYQSSSMLISLFTHPHVQTDGTPWYIPQCTRISSMIIPLSTLPSCTMGWVGPAWYIPQCARFLPC